MQGAEQFMIKWEGYSKSDNTWHLAAEVGEFEGGSKQLKEFKKREVQCSTLKYCT